MARATWNGKVIAESETFETLDGTVYFPPDAMKGEYFSDSDHTTVCGWKGTASYYHVVVDGKENQNAAWVYRDPKEAASKIKAHVAFWKGVQVEE